MKNTVLRIKAELENVKKIYCDDDFLWAFNSKHLKCKYYRLFSSLFLL